MALSRSPVRRRLSVGERGSFQVIPAAGHTSGAVAGHTSGGPTADITSAGDGAGRGPSGQQQLQLLQKPPVTDSENQPLLGGHTTSSGSTSMNRGYDQPLGAASDSHTKGHTSHTKGGHTPFASLLHAAPAAGLVGPPAAVLTEEEGGGGASEPDHGEGGPWSRWVGFLCQCGCVCATVMWICLCCCSVEAVSTPCDV